MVKNFQKTQIHNYAIQSTALITLFPISLKQKLINNRRLKRAPNYIFYLLIGTSNFSAVSKHLWINSVLVNLTFQNNQFYLSITDNSKRCLITCSSGSIANLTHASMSNNNTDLTAWKKAKKSKSFFNTLVQAFQKIFLLQKFNIRNNTLTVVGSSKVLIDFLVMFEYSFFLKWFFCFFFKLKKPFGLNERKKKKAVKRRIFKKLISLDKIQYKHTKLYFGAHFIK